MKIRKIFVAIFIFIIMLSGYKVFALDIETEQNYSKKYEEWLALPEEEREKTIAPLPVNITKTKENVFQRALKALKNASIPEKFDLRDHINIEVKNQMDTGECWAFSALSDVEMNLALNGEEYQFSERHMEYETSQSFYDGDNPMGLDRVAGQGGYNPTAFTYYSRGSGPILEEDMPFENNERSISIKDLPNNLQVKKVDDMIYFPSIYKHYDNAGNLICTDANENEYSQAEVLSIRNQIKRHIMENGGVTIAIYAPNDYTFYNPTEHSSNVTYQVYSNHDVTIIGWDDNYSKNNFKMRPANDGAYIVLNSWGEDWGDNGIYYISYEDTLVEGQVRGVKNVSNIEYDKIYQYDISEMYATLPSKYSENLFVAEENEQLTDVMIGTLDEQDCNIYIKINQDMIKIADRVNLLPGYNTIKLNTPIDLTQGMSFGIVVEILNDNISGIGVECYVPGMFGNPVSEPNQSFISDDGINWVDTYDKNDYMNFAIKAYTKRSKTYRKIVYQKYENNRCIFNDFDTFFKVIYKVSNDLNGTTSNISILDQNNNDVSEKFIIENNAIIDRLGRIVIKATENAEVGIYTINIIDGDSVESCTFNVNSYNNFDTNIYMKVQIPDANFYDALKNYTFNADDIYGYFDENQELIVRKDVETINLYEAFMKKDGFLINGEDFEIGSIEGIEKFTNLTYLNLGSNHIKDFEYLRNLTKLETLVITSGEGQADSSFISDVENYDAIGNLANLKFLRISNYKINNTDFFESLVNLDILELRNCGITDITSICTLSNLNTLDLSSNQIEDITGINNLNVLSCLKIGNNNVRDIAMLHDMTSLYTLYLNENEISDLSSLEFLTGLRELSIGYNNISSLEKINNLTNLKLLYVDGLNITDISFINNFSNLECVSFNDNNISDITPISNLNNLLELYMSNNNISDITPISNLKNLKRLFLSNNKIVNIMPIADIRNSLEIIDLSENCIEDASIFDEYYFSELGYGGLVLDNNKINKDINVEEISGSIVVELPVIIQQAINPESILYTPYGELKNCNFYELGKSIEIKWDNDNTEAKVIVYEGALNYTTFNVRIILPDEQITIPFEDDKFGKLIYESCCDEFDTIDYNNKTITTLRSKIRKMKNLWINSDSNVSNIFGIEFLENLESIYIEGTQIENLNEIAKLNRITGITINNCLIEDLSFINNIPSVECVNLYNTRTDCRNLMNLPSLIVNEDFNIDKDTEIIVLPDIFQEVSDSNNLAVSLQIPYADEYASYEYPNEYSESIPIYKNRDGKKYINIDRTINNKRFAGERYILIHLKENEKNGIDISYKYFYEVQDEEVLIQFEDNNFANIIFNALGDEGAILNNEEKTILTRNSKISNIKYLYIQPEDMVNNLKGIEKLTSLENIHIYGNNLQIENIENITHLPKLMNLYLIDVRLEDYGFIDMIYSLKFLGLNNISKEINIESFPNLELERLTLMNSNDLEGNPERIYLPEDFMKAYNYGNVYKFEANLSFPDVLVYHGEIEDYYSENLEIKYDENNLPYVDVDYEITNSKPAGRREIVIFINTSKYTLSNVYSYQVNAINYIEIDSKKYVEIKDTQNNKISDIIKLENFPGATKIEVKDINNKILTEDDKLGTGTTITIYDENNEVIDSYIISVLGDLDGNGEIDLYDPIRLVELVMDSPANYVWENYLKLAGNCDKISEKIEMPDVYDILRLIEFYFDNKVW